MPPPYGGGVMGPGVHDEMKHACVHMWEDGTEKIGKACDQGERWSVVTCQGGRIVVSLSILSLQIAAACGFCVCCPFLL